MQLFLFSKLLVPYNKLYVHENQDNAMFFFILQQPDEEPIYISVSGDEEDVPPKPPPIYHVLEDLRPNEDREQESQDQNDE
jgi:hypothetical protein